MLFYNNYRGNREAGRRYFPKELPPTMLVKRYFADRYGWTPRQVDELTLSELELLPLIEMASREASELIQRQES